MDENNIIKNNDYSEILLHNICVSIQIVKLLYDDQGEANDYLILDVNPAFVESSGHTKEKIIGKKLQSYFYLLKLNGLLSLEKLWIGLGKR